MALTGRLGIERWGGAASSAERWVPQESASWGRNARLDRIARQYREYSHKSSPAPGDPGTHTGKVHETVAPISGVRPLRQMRKLVLKNFQSPRDVLMLAAA